MNVAIYIYDQAEILDFSGPFEVFSKANHIMEADSEPFNVFFIAEQKKAVNARYNFQVIPHYSIDEHPKIDVLIVVGGYHNDEINKPKVISWIAKQVPMVSLVSSVCTGAFLLAKTGKISGKNVTTHWEDIADLQRMFPDINVLENQRWVEHGNLVTSAGISAGIDMSLYLVSKLAGKALADKTARQMEYDWQKTN